MSRVIVVSCPKCSQKYRVSSDKQGMRARCPCGQRFLVASNGPIDEDTILGWVVEGADPASQSVMGATGIMESPVERRNRRPRRRSARPAGLKPGNGGIRLARLDELGAHFDFPAEMLADYKLRASFPKHCVSCAGKRHLHVHLIVWKDKLPRDDGRRIREVNHKMIGKLQDLAGYDKMEWLNDLPKVRNLSRPFSLPFPFFVCANCTLDDEVTTAVFTVQNVAHCQILIANLEVAAKFFRNNGGRERPEYKRLVRESEKQKKDRWRSLPIAVRRQISQWHKSHDDEQFKGYFPDSDFSDAEAGKAGIVLTDRRLTFHKYSSSREFSVREAGRIYLEPERKSTAVRIVQKGRKDATTNLDPACARQLVDELRSASKWKVSGDTHTWEHGLR